MGLPVAAIAVGPRLGVAVATERKYEKAVYQCAASRCIAATPRRGPTFYNNTEITTDTQMVSRILSGKVNFSFKSIAEMEDRLGIDCFRAAACV